MAGKETLEEQIASDKANLDGAREPLDQLKGMLVQFTPDFQMMPGTKPATPASSVARDPFEQHPPALTDGG